MWQHVLDVAGNMCLMFVQVSFYQAAKSQHILCILLISYFFLAETHPTKYRPSYHPTTGVPRS